MFNKFELLRFLPDFYNSFFGKDKRFTDGSLEISKLSSSSSNYKSHINYGTLDRINKNKDRNEYPSDFHRPLEFDKVNLSFNHSYRDHFILSSYLELMSKNERFLKDCEPVFDALKESNDLTQSVLSRDGGLSNENLKKFDDLFRSICSNLKSKEYVSLTFLLDSNSGFGSGFKDGVLNRSKRLVWTPDTDALNLSYCNLRLFHYLYLFSNKSNFKGNPVYPSTIHGDELFDDFRKQDIFTINRIDEYLSLSRLREIESSLKFRGLMEHSQFKDSWLVGPAKGSDTNSDFRISVVHPTPTHLDLDFKHPLLFNNRGLTTSPRLFEFNLDRASLSAPASKIANKLYEEYDKLLGNSESKVKGNTEVALKGDLVIFDLRNFLDFSNSGDILHEKRTEFLTSSYKALKGVYEKEKSTGLSDSNFNSKVPGALFMFHNGQGSSTDAANFDCILLSLSNLKEPRFTYLVKSDGSTDYLYNVGSGGLNMEKLTNFNNYKVNYPLRLKEIPNSTDYIGSGNDS